MWKWLFSHSVGSEIDWDDICEKAVLKEKRITITQLEEAKRKVKAIEGEIAELQDWRNKLCPYRASGIIGIRSSHHPTLIERLEEAANDYTSPTLWVAIQQRVAQLREDKKEAETLIALVVKPKKEEGE